MADLAEEFDADILKIVENMTLDQATVKWWAWGANKIRLFTRWNLPTAQNIGAGELYVVSIQLCRWPNKVSMSMCKSTCTWEYIEMETLIEHDSLI